MSTRKQFLILCAGMMLMVTLTGCQSAIADNFKTILTNAIQMIGFLLVVSALISGAILIIQGKINLLTGSSRGVTETIVALVAIFAGLILGLLGPAFVDAIYSGVSGEMLNTIPLPYASQ